MAAQGSDELGGLCGNEVRRLIFQDQQVQQLEGEGLQPLALGEDIIRRVHGLLLGQGLGPQQVRVADDRGHRRF